DCQLYVEKMISRDHGYPLYIPQPHRSLPIEYRLQGSAIGDVGFVTPNGAFEFLFNI
ncbi:hypothetical protein BDQ17DRAFT_1213259, partial [Cyathus striatus]